MPAATLTAPREMQIGSAATSLFVAAPQRTPSEPSTPTGENETTLAEAALLEQETFGESLIVGAGPTLLEQLQSSELDMSITSGAARSTLPRAREHIAPDVRPYLSGHMLHLFRILLAIAQTKANTSRLAIEGIRTYMFRDPEENTRKFVLMVTVKANTAQAMAYWDALGSGVDTWRDGLSEHLRQMLVSRWSFRVNWCSDGST